MRVFFEVRHGGKAMNGRVLGIVLTTGVTLGLSGCGGGEIGCDNKTVSGGPSGGPGISVGSGTCSTSNGGGAPGGGTVQLGTPLGTVYYVKTGVAPTISAVGIDAARNFLPLTNFTP